MKDGLLKGDSTDLPKIKNLMVGWNVTSKLATHYYLKNYKLIRKNKTPFQLLI